MIGRRPRRAPGAPKTAVLVCSPGGHLLQMQELHEACAFFKLLGTYPVDSH